MSMLDKGPQIPGCSGTEPSLRQLVHLYYEAHFPLAEANVLAMEYLNQVAKSPHQSEPMGEVRYVDSTRPYQGTHVFWWLSPGDLPVGTKIGAVSK